MSVQVKSKQRVADHGEVFTNERFMVLLKKPTQNSSKGSYQFVPLQDFSKPWTDAELYAKYGLDEKEIAYIESMVREME